MPSKDLLSVLWFVFSIGAFKRYKKFSINRNGICFEFRLKNKRTTLKIVTKKTSEDHAYITNIITTRNSVENKLRPQTA